MQFLGIPREIQEICETEVDNRQKIDYFVQSLTEHIEECFVEDMSHIFCWGIKYDQSHTETYVV